MLRFLVDRLLQSAVVLLIMSFVVYGLLGLMPGDPLDLMLTADPHMTPADAERLRALYDLDRPILARYLDWLAAALTGDFGVSRLHARPVLEVIPAALANTLILMGASFVLSIAIAIPLGILAALNPNSRLDHAINLAVFAGISVPPFWLALLLILLFAVTLGWLPAGGLGTGSGGVIETLRFAALPVLSLTLASVGGHIRYVRAAMIETLRQDYVRTARAKGLGPLRVVAGHALRNGLIPVITVIAVDMGLLFSGALITETVFAWPGMGRLIYDAILGNDYNLALIALLFATLLTLAGNLLADIAYVLIDPRVTFRGAGR